MRESIRIVCISDTHNLTDREDFPDIPDGDILIHTGDFTICGKENDVIKLDILYAYLPEKTKRVFDFFTNLICGMILILSLPKSMEYIEFMSIERTAYLRINFALLFSIYVPFAVVVSFRCLLNAWNALKGKGYEAEFEV